MQVPIVTPNFYLTLGDTHEQLGEKIAPSSQSHTLIWNMRTQVTEVRLNVETTAEPCYAKTAAKISKTEGHFLIFKVRQGCHLFVIADILHSL